MVVELKLWGLERLWLLGSRCARCDVERRLLLLEGTLWALRYC
jgi:hypothetical protein